MNGFIAGGMDIRDSHTGEGASGYSVAVRKHVRVSVTEMQQYSQRFRTLAEQYGGYYDGWVTDPSRTGSS